MIYYFNTRDSYAINENVIFYNPACLIDAFTAVPMDITAIHAEAGITIVHVQALFDKCLKLRLYDRENTVYGCYGCQCQIKPYSGKSQLKSSTLQICLTEKGNYVTNITQKYVFSTE